MALIHTSNSKNLTQMAFERISIGHCFYKNKNAEFDDIYMRVYPVNPDKGLSVRLSDGNTSEIKKDTLVFMIGHTICSETVAYQLHETQPGSIIRKFRGIDLYLRTDRMRGNSVCLISLKNGGTTYHDQTNQVILVKGSYIEIK